MERRSDNVRVNTPWTSALYPVVAAALLANTLVACSPTPANGTPQVDAVAIAVANDPAPFGYDPAGISGGGVTTFWEGLYDSLFAPTSDGSIKPGLATRYSFNADKTVLTLTLRDGVKFSDGSTLTSALVKANLDRRADPSLAAYSAVAKGGAAEITNVSAPDPQTVVITFAQPTASAPSLLADYSGRIVGQKAIDNPKSLLTTPDGSGPYILSNTESVKGSSYVLNRNKDAWNADAYSYAKVTFKQLGNAQSQANALVSGQVAVAPVDSTTKSLVASKMAVTDFPGTVFAFTLFDKLGKVSQPFADVKVREALSLAIDRKKVASIHDGAFATANYIPKGQPGYDANLEHRYAYDPAKAKQLLAAAGYPNGFSFPMQAAGNTYDLDLQAVKEQWQQIGVNMNIEHVTQPLQTPRVTPLGYFAFAYGLNPLSWVESFLLAGGVNPQHASDPAIKSALAGAESGQGNEGEAGLIKVNNAIVNQGWSISVYSQPTYVGYNPKKVSKPVASSSGVYPLLSSISAVKS
ncbi:ABC transporter substrate-binding protein [Paraburkholderia bannensis]|uniref:ABC transporter substrate-binding protein n=1 Tax=Paraburkholderia bannensis TaxID=765414 RepID=UPI002AB70C2E|nr:ABC transporter substrate-binding protein [Paraburkholderia bannensis]